MTLHEFMTLERLNHEQMAERIGCSLGGLKKWLRGVRTPQPDWMREIHRATGGKVTPNDLVLGANPN